MPFFTIIIPVYNASDTLEETLLSALDQTFSDYEIIVVNDGSTDDSAEVLEAVQERHPGVRLHVIEQQNEGLSAARNIAVFQADGQYCAFLDADDIWEPQKLEKCYEFLQKAPDCDVLYHKVSGFTRRRERIRGAYALQSVEQLLREGNPIIPSACIVKTVVLKEFPFTTDEKFQVAEDLHLWIQLLQAGKTFHYWPEVLGAYREEGGMSTAIEEHLKSVFAVLNHFYDTGLYNQTMLERARQRKFYEAARFYQKNHQRFLAERYYSAADSKSMKIIGMRFLNFLGINF